MALLNMMSVTGHRVTVTMTKLKHVHVHGFVENGKTLKAMTLKFEDVSSSGYVSKWETTVFGEPKDLRRQAEADLIKRAKEFGDFIEVLDASTW